MDVPSCVAVGDGSGFESLETVGLLSLDWVDSSDWGVLVLVAQLASIANSRIAERDWLENRRIVLRRRSGTR